MPTLHSDHSWTLPVPQLAVAWLRRVRLGSPPGRAGPSPWWLVPAAVLAVALLQAYWLTVHRVLAQGDAHRAMLAQQAEGRRRCLSLNDRQRSSRCLQRLAEQNSAPTHFKPQ